LGRAGPPFVTYNLPFAQSHTQNIFPEYSATPGRSFQGADEDVRIAIERVLKVYYHIADVPQFKVIWAEHPFFAD